MNFGKEKDSSSEKKEEAHSLMLVEEAKEECKVRLISLFGTIDEEKTEEMVESLLVLHMCGKEKILIKSEDCDTQVEGIAYKPIDFHISTWGGCARGMFAIYDAMRAVREDCEIITYGLGKVMSAGVLLLASGTKNKRKIGKNCCIMLHSVRADQWGPIHNLENEMEEIKWLQEQHINALVEETDMTKKHLMKLLDRKVNVYLSADQAIEYGIADIIV